MACFGYPSALTRESRYAELQAALYIKTERQSMKEFDAVLRQKRSRIIDELCEKHDVGKRDAIQIVDRGFFDTYPLIEAIKRLKIMRNALGDVISGTVIRGIPSVIGHPLERLQPLVDLLVSRGHPLSDVQRIVSVHISLLQRETHEIAETYEAIRSLLPIQNAHRFFITCKPEALLLSAERIRSCTVPWNDDPERFWQALIDDIQSQPMDMPEQGPSIKGTEDRIRPIIDRFRASGIGEQQAARFAKRLYRLAGERSTALLERFACAEWTLQDVGNLLHTIRNREWAMDPTLLFRAEAELMTALEITRDQARSLATYRPEFSSSSCDFQQVREAAKALRVGGLSTDELIYIARIKHRALFVSRQRVEAWFKSVLNRGGGRNQPLRALGMLAGGWKIMDPRIDIPPLKPNGIGANVLVVPADPTPSVPDEDPEAEARAKALARIKLVADVQARAEAAERAKAEAEARVLADAQARVLAEAEAKAHAATEKIARAEAEAKARAEALVRAQTEAVARHKAQTEAKARARAEAQAKADEWARKQAELRALARAKEEARARAEARAMAADSMEDSHHWDWRSTIKAVLELTQTDEILLEPWEQFSNDPANQPYLVPSESTQNALRRLALWIALPESPTQRSDAVVLFARILRERTLRPVLDLTVEVMQFRLMVVTKLLERNFRNRPEDLLHPFEKFSPAELHFRVNEMRARREKIRNAQDLLAPTREAFLKQFEEAKLRDRYTDEHLPIGRFQPFLKPYPLPLTTKKQKPKRTPKRKVTRRSKKKT